LTRSASKNRGVARGFPLDSARAPGSADPSDNLSFAARSKGGTNNWEAHHRVPPGRKRLPRLSANGETAARPQRGGSLPKTKREAPITDVLIF
jgi:hypothetical protein